ncbi:MAG: hypothetical protein ACK500_14100 [Flavobacteriales bacterium]|jgi:hypothetical protein
MARKYGLVGIDMAYLIALIGTMFVTLFFVIGDRQFNLEYASFFVWIDFFHVFFVFLSGYTFAVGLRDRSSSSRRKLSNAAKKGSLFFLIGLLFIGSWAINMFLALGVFYLLAGLIGQLGNFILRSAAVLVFLASMICLNLDIPPDHRAEYFALTLQGAGAKELLAYLLYNGYLSVFPWLSFFLAGMVFGNGNIRPNGWFPPSSIVGTMLIVLSLFAEMYSKGLYTPSPTWNTIGTYPLNMKFFMPSFVLFETGLSIITLNLLNYAYRKNKNKKLQDLLRKIVESRFSILFAMMFGGSLIMALFNLIIFKKAFVLFVLSVIIITACLYGIILWKRNFTAKTPVEWIVKRISSSTKS